MITEEQIRCLFHIKLIINFDSPYFNFIVQGPVVQSIVSLTKSLRGHLVKCIPTTLSNTLLFLLKKCENLLHCKRFSHFSNKK